MSNERQRSRRSIRGFPTLGVAVGLVYAFLLLPMVIVVLAAFNAGNYFTLLSVDLIAIAGSRTVTGRALHGIV